MIIQVYLYIIVVGTLGFMIGSFLNVVINRLYTKEDLVKKRSHCPKCNAVLRWYELIPVASFIAQKGKCRNCGKKISWQYPIVELATALLFIGIYALVFQSQNCATLLHCYIATLFLWTVASGLLIIFAYDLKHFIIPDIILVLLIFVALAGFIFGIYNFEFVSDLGFKISNLTNAAKALGIGLLASIPFFAIHLLSRGRAMGFGDVKLVFFMGLLLGFPNIILAIFLAFILGGIAGSILIILKQKNLKSQMPFGPFLILGTYVALFWGQELINWYLNLFI